MLLKGRATNGRYTNLTVFAKVFFKSFHIYLIASGISVLKLFPRVHSNTKAYGGMNERNVKP